MLTKAHTSAPAGDPFPGALLGAAGRDVRVRRRLEPLRLGLHPLPAAGRRAGGRDLRRARGVRLLCAAGDVRRGGVHRAAAANFSDNPDRRLHRAAARLAGRAHPAGDRTRRDRGERAEHLLQRDVVRRHGDQAADPVDPRGGRGGDGHRRLRGRRDRAASHRLVRELPAGHRLLGRAMARGGVRRPGAAAVPRRRGHLHRPALCELGRPDRDAGRRRGVDLAVLGPGVLHRPGRQGRARHRRHDVHRRVPARLRALRRAAEAPGGADHVRPDPAGRSAGDATDAAPAAGVAS